MTDELADRLAGLAECPFCGGDKLNVGFTRATDTFAFWSVECVKCGVEVADDESEAGAINHWNTRTPASAPDREAADKYHGIVCNAFGPTPMCCSCGVEEAFAAHRSAAEQRGFELAREMAVKEAERGRNYWRDKCSSTKNRRESRDYETMAIACVHIEHAIKAISPERTDDHP